MLKNTLTPATLGLLSFLLAPAMVAFAADEAQQPTPEASPAKEAATPPAQQDAVPDPVVVVDGDPISKDVYEAYAQQRQRQMGNVNTAEARKTLTDELVIQQLLIKDAEKQGLAKDPKVALQMEMARRNLLATAAVRKFFQEHAPAEEAIKKEYETVAAKMKGKEYKARHILVKSEDEAKNLIKDLDKGGDFAELAKAHSTDSSSSKGGDLGWFTPEVMVKPFSEAVTKLEKGKYTEQPVQSQFGWHIIKLDDVRDATPPSLDELRPQLVQMLQGRLINDYLETLRQQAKVDIK